MPADPNTAALAAIALDALQEYRRSRHGDKLLIVQEVLEDLAGVPVKKEAA